MEQADLGVIAARRHAEPILLIHLVKGDLDWIVMKAMDKQPSRRYESASQLAEDLRRHLNTEPVLARPPSTVYRLSKFLRRHRAAAAITLTISTLVIAFGAIMAVQAARIAQERDRAQAQARRAEVVSSYLLDLFDSSDPTSETFDESETEVARRILLRGLERADALTGEPEAQAYLLGGIGMVLHNRGLIEDAHDVLERAVRARPGASDEIAARNIVSLGRAKTDLGRYDEAESLLVRGIALEDSLHAEPHSDPATARRWLGELRRAQNRLDDAEKLLREAAEIQRSVQGAQSLDYASTISSLSHVLRVQGKLEESLALVQEAREIQFKVLGKRHGDVAISTTNLAGLLRELGRPEEAEPLYQEALAMHRDLYGEVSSNTAIAYNNYGVFLRGEGKAKEARAVLEKAVAISEQTSGAESPAVAKILANLGRACNSAGDPAAGERHLRRALGIQTPLLPAEDPSLASLRSDLGESLIAQGRYAAAEQELLESQRNLAEARGAEHASTRTAAERLVRLYEAWGKPDAAKKWRAETGGS
jgi:serine/threonine-protein kinase